MCSLQLWECAELEQPPCFIDHSPTPPPTYKIHLLPMEPYAPYIWHDIFLLTSNATFTNSFFSDQDSESYPAVKSLTIEVKTMCRLVFATKKHGPPYISTSLLANFWCNIDSFLWWGFETHLVSKCWMINGVCLFLVRWCVGIKMLSSS